MNCVPCWIDSAITQSAEFTVDGRSVCMMHLLRWLQTMQGGTEWKPEK